MSADPPAHDPRAVPAATSLPLPAGTADSPTATPALTSALAALQSGDFAAGWEATKRLPPLGAIAIPPLIQLLNAPETDPDTRWLAARSLAACEAPAAVAALADLLHRTTDEDLAILASQALATAGPQARTALIAALAAVETRLGATRALAQFGEAVEPLLSVVQDANPEVRWLAIAGLSHSQEARVLPVLITALQDPVAQVRREAVSALGLWADRDPPSDLLLQLQPCLYDPDLGVSQQAAFALSRFQTPAAAAALSQALHGSAIPVALQCDLLRALGWLRVPQRLEYLRQALQALPATAARLETIRSLARATAAQERAIASRILADWFATPAGQASERPVQQALAQAWGQLGTPRARAALEQLLAAPDASVRLHARAAWEHWRAQGEHEGAALGTANRIASYQTGRLNPLA